MGCAERIRESGGVPRTVDGVVLAHVEDGAEEYERLVERARDLPLNGWTSTGDLLVMRERGRVMVYRLEHIVPMEGGEE